MRVWLTWVGGSEVECQSTMQRVALRTVLLCIVRRQEASGQIYQPKILWLQGSHINGVVSNVADEQPVNVFVTVNV